MGTPGLFLPPRAAGFHPLLWSQALTAFHHNQLRAAVLTLVAFGHLSMPGLAPESVVALTTLLAVAPYVFLSMAAGRHADRWPKAKVIRAAKLFEAIVALVGAAGLLLANLPLLLLAILLAGIEAAALGPAKFAVLPEMLGGHQLVAGNAWVTATSTLAVLVGLITGNLLALGAAGPLILSVAGAGLAVLGWLLSLLIPAKPPSAVEQREASWRDSWRVLKAVGRDRRLAVTVLGCSWFWFQGAFITTLVPLYVAGAGQPDELVSLLLVVTTLGVVLGALAARWLEARYERQWLPLAVALSIAAPAIGIGTVPPEPVWMIINFAILSAGTGLFIVPMSTAMQVFGANADRARLIGVNHLLNGIAMLLAGFGVAVLGAIAVSPATGMMLAGLGTAVVAWFALALTLRSLRGDQGAGAVV